MDHTLRHGVIVWTIAACRDNRSDLHSREGFGINRITVLASILYAGLLLLFVLATKATTAANAIFLQYTAPLYVLILEPILYKEKFQRRDLITSLLALRACHSSL